MIRRAPALLAACLFMGMAPHAVSAQQRTARPVSVVFVQPERFIDAKDRCLGSAVTTPVLEALRSFLVEAAGRHLPAGMSLAIRITDVDLAGEFEPARAPEFCATRIVRAGAGPRIDLEFRLLDETPRVVREGTRRLRDPLFTMRTTGDETDRLRHEKALLRRWLRDELADLARRGTNRPHADSIVVTVPNERRSHGHL
jgi:Protein of unknown function (DUF3016)